MHDGGWLRSVERLTARKPNRTGTGIGEWELSAEDSKPPRVSSRAEVVFGPVDQLSSTGRLAGLDYGTVRIGIASCDPSQTWVTPLDTYRRRSEKLDRDFFVDLSEKEDLVGWVIGLPIHCDGKESQKSAEVRQFACWLAEISSLPYLFFDERFTTAEARRLLSETNLSPEKKKKQLDRIAAHLILSHYLTDRSRTASQNGALED